MKTIRLLKFVCFLFLLMLFLSAAHSVHAIETKIRDVGLTSSIPYFDTEIDLRIGDYLTIRPVSDTSVALYPPERTVPWVTPMGDPGCIAGPDYTIPGIHCWALIARIGSGNPFFVGTNLSSMPVLQNGRLYVGINHKIPFTGSGSFLIRIIANYFPPPTPPTPFLELPWDYTSQGKSFGEAAGAINSYFDHEYPLLSVRLALPEPPDSATTTVNYENIAASKPFMFYSSHDGYDWGTDAGATLNEPVLAAADGCAHYYYNAQGSGNAIFINHGNHYQTRYYHLIKDSPITLSETQCIPVTQGQQIGLVGATGNSDGAHIHFMVIEDKNRDGDFEDNIPDGLTDPFGWQSETADPWPNYSWVVGEDTDAITYYGNDSHYLWLHPIPDLNAELPTNGAFFEFQNLKLNFPPNAVKEKTKLEILLAPFVSISETLESVGTTFIITLKNFFNTPVTTLNQLYSITFDYANEDLSRVDPDTLTIYSSEDGVNWTPEVTTLDSITKTASATLNHLTHFALIGERLDTEPPVTTLTYSQQSNNNDPSTSLGAGNSAISFSVPTIVTFEPSDNYSEVDYTLYKLNDADWQEYSEPLEFSEEGTYNLEYYSVDQHENIEETKTTTVELNFPEIIPEAIISVNPHNFAVALTATGSGELTHEQEQLPEGKVSHVFTDGFNQNITLLTKPVHTWLYDQLKVEALTYSPALESTASGTLIVSGLKDRKGVLTMLTTWKTPDYLLTVFFERFTNRTYVVKTKGKQVLLNDKLPGLRLLEVRSNKGMLEYEY